MTLLAATSPTRSCESEICMALSKSTSDSCVNSDDTLAHSAESHSSAGMTSASAADASTWSASNTSARSYLALAVMLPSSTRPNKVSTTPMISRIVEPEEDVE